MKQKLNLTINQRIIEQSKKYARQHGISVSELIENLLTHQINQNDEFFTKKWTGKLKLAEKDDPRFLKLKERYL